MEGDISNDDGNNKQTCEPNFHHYTLFDVTVDPGLKDGDGNELPRPFTKNQMRNWLKKVRWEKNKVFKRTKQREREKKRIQEARAANLDLGPTRKTLKKKSEIPKKNIGIIIDLSFDDLMIEKDLGKLIKQILRCYSINRRSDQPLQFHITSLGRKSKEMLSRHNGYENWDVAYHEEPYLNIFAKEKLVYLTSESENVIENFEENTFYIIGGLVDHNQYKGLCHKIAVEQGIQHARLPLDKYINMKSRKVLTIDHLPLDKYINMKSRKVLTIDHVFEIVIRVSEKMSWQEALLKVLPERKGAQVCDDESTSSIDNIEPNNSVISA